MTRKMTRQQFMRTGLFDFLDFIRGDEEPAPVTIDAARCFSARGQPCDYCHIYCPEKPRAIERFEPGRLPPLDADRCTACGACARICPAGAMTVRAPGGSR